MAILHSHILQAQIEDSFSRHNIRKIITDALKQMDFKLLKRQATKQVINYITGKDYYHSKQARVDHLRKNVLISDIVDEILIITVPPVGQQPIQAASARLAQVLKFENAYAGIKTAAELLTVVCETDLYDIILAKNSETGSIMLESNYKLDESVLQELEDKKYLPPMICEPQPITNNYTSGYLTKNDSVILGSGNHHEEYQALDILNIAGAIPLCLDKAVLLEEEKSKRPLDTPEKMSNFLRIVISSRHVYEDLIKQGNQFYLNWKFDKRGRVYSQGYQVNLQSTSFKKAILNLKKKELIT